MRITIVSTAYPLRGGIAHYVSLLHDHLSRRNHSVSVVTFKRQYPKLLFPGKSQEEKADGISSFRAPQIIDTVNPFTWFKTGKFVAGQKPDLIIFKYWMPFFAPAFGIIARIAKRKSGCKVLFICDNVLPHERTPIDKLLTSWLFKIADYYIVQSKSVEKDLLSVVDRPEYRLVPHPVYEIFGSSKKKEDARARLGIRSNENVALFFGYVRKYKGLHVLLDAMKEVLKAVDVHLLVVGEFYEDEKSYLAQVAALDLGENVRIISDYVPNDEVSIYFSAADVVVLPYIDATQSGIVQIAYNFHKPVIATDVGGLAEVVLDGKSGLIVNPGSKRELADAIVRFFTENLSSQLSAGATEQKKLYSWDNMVNKIEELGEGRNVHHEPGTN